MAQDTIQNLCSLIRQAAGRGLPEGAALMRDRGDALYIVRSPEDISVSGFTAVRRGEYVALYPEEEVLKLAEAFADEADPLERSLSRFRGFSRKASLLFAAIVKAREANDLSALPALEKALRQSSAKALREGGGEGLYWCAIALKARPSNNKETAKNDGIINS